MSELEVQAGLGRFTVAQSAATHRFGIVGITAALFAGFIVVAGIWPSVLAPGDPLAINPLDAFAPPSAAHWFGTDESGRDIYTRVIHGAGSSLLIGLVATAIGLGLGILLGTIAGTLGKAVDFGVNRLLEVMFAFPGLLLALLFILILGPGPVTATIAVGLSTAPGYARIIRSQLISIRGSGFVEAATALGRTKGQILRRHILPNTLADRKSVV